MLVVADQWQGIRVSQADARFSEMRVWAKDQAQALVDRVGASVFLAVLDGWTKEQIISVPA